MKKLYGIILLTSLIASSMQAGIISTVVGASFLLGSGYMGKKAYDEYEKMNSLSGKVLSTVQEVVAPDTEISDKVNNLVTHSIQFNEEAAKEKFNFVMKEAKTFEAKYGKYKKPVAYGSGSFFFLLVALKCLR